MINKDLFVQTINFLEEREEFETKINESLAEEFGDCILFPYNKWYDQVIKLLSASFDYDDSIIEDWLTYYMYGLDYGKKWHPWIVSELNKVTGKEEDVPLSTPEELYDMLFKTACGDKFINK